jgi:hypothetical protein
MVAAVNAKQIISGASALERMAWITRAAYVGTPTVEAETL